MKLEGMYVGDLVLVDRKGRIFHAELTGKHHARSEVDIKPIEHNVSYRTAHAVDIVAHWRRVMPVHGRARSRPRQPAPPPAYAELGELNP